MCVLLFYMFLILRRCIQTNNLILFVLSYPKTTAVFFEQDPELSSPVVARLPLGGCLRGGQRLITKEGQIWAQCFLRAAALSSDNNSSSSASCSSSGPSVAAAAVTPPASLDALFSQVLAQKLGVTPGVAQGTPVQKP